MQTRPDWYQNLDKKGIEEAFKIQFNGPGLYLTLDDTILIVPSYIPGIKFPTTEKNIWDPSWPEETIFEVNVYNQPFYETILGMIEGIPIREGVGNIKRRVLVKDYPETHQRGTISIENPLEEKVIKGDLGIQIAKDGRVWICINGIAFLRFHPR